MAVVLAFALASFTTVAGPSTLAKAADSQDFQPGNIISDQNFFDYTSMTVADIQAFLDAKGPTSCTNCLRQYRANTYYRAPNPDRCPSAIEAKTNVSAAQMIYDVAQACHVSPKVMLVTLQKEMSLVTLAAPSDTRYQRAMGYACPDSAPCSSAYYGLFIQLYSAASQWNWYSNPKSNFTYYRIGATTAVRYNPNTSCGSSPVYIQNRATAALYYYTPYQPNAAALANLYGTGNSCSAYGNRNFWRLYSDWFGSPTAPPAALTNGTVVSDLAGTFYLIDAGSRVRIVDCVTVAPAFALTCVGAPVATQSRLDALTLVGDLSPLVTAPSGARYLFDAGKRREVLDDASLTAAGITGMTAVPLSQAFVDSFGRGAAIVRSGVLVADRSAPTTLTYIASVAPTTTTAMSVPVTLQNQTAIRTWLGTATGTLDTATLASFTSTPFPATFTVGGTTFGLAPTGRIELSPTAAWSSATPPALDAVVAALVPVLPGTVTAPAFVSHASDGKVFLIASATRAAIADESQRAALATQLGIAQPTQALADGVIDPLGVVPAPVVVTPTPTPTPPVTATPTPTPTPPPPASTPTVITHKVVAGDTVGALARKYGSTVAAIVAANGLNSKALIRVGQLLKIPITSTTPPPAATPTVINHKVVAGDTVWALARKYHSTVAAIIKANGLGLNALIRVGQVLKIPVV